MNMNILRQKISSYFVKQVRAATEPLRVAANRSLLLHALQLSQYTQTRSNIQSIVDVEFSVYSQWGEDGILAWLIARLPELPRNFIEFGVGDYVESNTRLLLQMNNWNGLIIDGLQQNIDSVKLEDIYWRNQLTAKHLFIDAENIDNILTDYAGGNSIGLLSIDVDGNDYWIWEAIKNISPSIVICEYNSLFGDTHAITIPYDPKFYRTEKHYSNLYFGASIAALITLGKKKGYQFIGTTSSGVNAFFVRSDLAPQVLSSLNEVFAYASKVREMRQIDGQLNFANKAEQYAGIKQMSVVNLTSNTLTSIEALGHIYSPEWIQSGRVKF